MMIGPAPMMRMVEMSVRLGMRFLAAVAKRERKRRLAAPN
jgi:hypothetical protein